MIRKCGHCMAYANRVSYAQEFHVTNDRYLSQYIFARRMILDHWLRNGIKTIPEEIKHLIIKYSSQVSPIANHNAKTTNSLRPRPQTMYLNAIRQTLDAVLCLRNNAPQITYYNRPMNYPNIETRYNKEYILNPLIISRNTHEKCLIEGSMNSVRI
eukprot:283142_1